MLTTYDPFGQMTSLRNAVDRLIQESFVWPQAPGWAAVGSVPVDLEETADAYVLTASLPGWKPEDVSVTFQGDTLTIAGEHKPAPEQGGDKTYHVRELAWQSFSRSFTFPMPVNADAVRAQFENGVLTLTIPKAEEAKPKQIPIGTGMKAIGKTSHRGK